MSKQDHGEQLKCSKIETSGASNAEKSSYLAPTTSNITLREVTPTPNAARLVARPVAHRVAEAEAEATAAAAVVADSAQTDRCSPQPAHSADKRPRYPLNPGVTDRSTATPASPNRGSPAAIRR